MTADHIPTTITQPSLVRKGSTLNRPLWCTLPHLATLAVCRHGTMFPSSPRGPTRSMKVHNGYRHRHTDHLLPRRSSPDPLSALAGGEGGDRTRTGTTGGGDGEKDGRAVAPRTRTTGGGDGETDGRAPATRPCTPIPTPASIPSGHCPMMPHPA